MSVYIDIYTSRPTTIFSTVAFANSSLLSVSPAVLDLGELPREALSVSDGDGDGDASMTFIPVPC